MDNPTEGVLTGFDGYVAKRMQSIERHLDGGAPDYLFSGDRRVRLKLDGMRPMRAAARAYAAHIVPREKRVAQMQYLRTGPSQYPKLNEMALQCAHRLGIGAPTLYIMPAPQRLDSDSFACDDVSPLIVLTSAIVERMTDDELFYIIGHECGHIQNNHGVYMKAGEALAAGTGLVGAGLDIALKAWVRAAEITADRAGVICCGGEKPALSALAKRTSGALLNNGGEMSAAALMEQLASVRETPVRLLEIAQSSPLQIRRMYAVQEFARSELFLSWNPAARTGDFEPIDRGTLEARCGKFVSILNED